MVGDISFLMKMMTPETLNILYLEQNLIFSSEKIVTTFQILPDVRN